MYNRTLISRGMTGLKPMRKNLEKTIEELEVKDIEAFRPREQYLKRLAAASAAGLNKSEIINRCLDASFDSVLAKMQEEAQAAFNRLLGASISPKPHSSTSSKIATAALPKKKR